MKPKILSLLLGLALVCSGQPQGEEPNGEKAGKPLCPMVAEPAKDGLFQLIEVIGADGKIGVGEPKEMVRLRCTIVNMTKRPLMVAEDYVTPQHGSMVVYGGVPNSLAEAKVPAITPVDHIMMSSSIDFPTGLAVWGHIRNWAHVAASHDLECGCCIEHRQYTKWLELQLPEGDWSTIKLELRQSIPAILLSPEAHEKFKSDLVLTIKRRATTTGAGDPVNVPESKNAQKAQPETDGHPR